LLDMLRARLDRATPSYDSRALALRGEDMQRRLWVVLRQGVVFAPDWQHALREEVPVYREQSAREAADHASELGDAREGARIMDRQIEQSLWTKLVQHADSAAVTFAEREHEAAWAQRILRYGDVS
jgi:hypothetical protein